jgi:hypothetical protein
LNQKPLNTDVTSCVARSKQTTNKRAEQDQHQLDTESERPQQGYGSVRLYSAARGRVCSPASRRQKQVISLRAFSNGTRRILTGIYFFYLGISFVSVVVAHGKLQLLLVSNCCKGTIENSSSYFLRV